MDPASSLLSIESTFLAMTCDAWTGEPTGRSEKYFVKEFEADTNLRCCLVVDTSGSMDYGSGSTTKARLCPEACRDHWLPSRRAGRRRGAIVRCRRCGQESAGETQSVSPSARCLICWKAPNRKVPTHLVPTLHELAETIRQRALIILVSDLFVDPEELRDCFQHLQFRHHDLAVFHLYDPLELSFDLSRPTRFQDMEGGTSIFCEPSEIADRYHRALEEYRDQIKQVTLEAAVDYHEVSIDDDYEQVLSRFLVGRTRRKGVA